MELVPSSPWWGEHRTRYHFAASRVRNAVALDMACGTGFGTRILIDAGAKAVIGVDMDEAAVRTSATRRSDSTLICRGDGTRLPLGDATIDLAASFETVEHIEDDEAFIRDLRRVLKPSGTLLISTPNALHSRPVDGKPVNPFHVREYTPDEFLLLLKPHFPDVVLLGQRARAAYKINPFWQHREDLLGPSTRRAFMWWRLQNRLPFRVKDRLSRLLLNRSFYPGEYDWIFTPEGLDDAHVTVAVCR